MRRLSTAILCSLLLWTTGLAAEDAKNNSKLAADQYKALTDEFQQVGESKSVARDVNNSLHAIFNRCPNSLSLFISFSGRPERSYPSWLSRELADRIGVQKVVVLPPLTRAEARLRNFQPGYRIHRDTQHGGQLNTSCLAT